jgi:hypothetical protein
MFALVLDFRQDIVVPAFLAKCVITVQRKGLQTRFIVETDLAHERFVRFLG